MWERTCEALIVGIVVSSCFYAQASGNTKAKREKIEFGSGSSLVFSEPLNKIEEETFGLGWKKAIFIDGYGNQMALFPMESFTSMNGLIFDETYPPRISPYGKYAVLSVLLAGTVDPGSAGSAANSGKQYCPVLNTVSGCIVCMQTGELCDGDWSEKADKWDVTGSRYAAVINLHTDSYGARKNNFHAIWNTGIFREVGQ